MLAQVMRNQHAGNFIGMQRRLDIDLLANASRTKVEAAQGALIA
jgi:hypothetical protein